MDIVESKQQHLTYTLLGSSDIYCS